MLYRQYLIITFASFILACISTFSNTSHQLQTLMHAGNLLCNEHRYEEAITWYDQVIAHNPDDYHALYNKAYALKSMGKYAEAIPWYERTLEKDPSHEWAHYGLAQAQLATGNFKEGFINFEWRLANPSVRICAPINIDEYAGKRVILRSEFGFGDILQFIRYAQLFHMHGAIVIAQVHTPLVPLLRNCPYLSQVLPVGALLPPADAEFPTLSLARAFDTVEKTIPHQVPYLYANKDLIKEWHSLLSTNKKLKVGICWMSDPRCHLEANPYTRRSISLSDFAPLAAVEEVQLYCLQKISNSSFIELLPQHMNVKHFGDDFDEQHGNFMDTAAVMKNLDLVITVDTVTAHLAGALNVPVWIIVPEAAEWRWRTHGSSSAWYPTARIFRRAEFSSWRELMSVIAQELQMLATSNT